MRIIGQEQIAAIFEVAPKTIVEWQEQGLPVALRGGPGVPSEYASGPCIAWLVGREVTKVSGAETPRDRLARVQADRIEMDMAKERAQLIPANQIEPALRAAHVAAREMLRASRALLARQAHGKTVEEIEHLVAAAHDEFLTRMSNWRTADDDEDEPDDGSGSAPPAAVHTYAPGAGTP